MFESGKIEFHQVLVIAVSLGVIVTDLARRKIYNVWLAPFLIAGFAIAFLASSWSGLGTSLVGCLVGLLVFLPLYRSTHMGAGDVKFMMTLGALMGPYPVLVTALLALPLGGLIAVLQLMRERRLVATVRKWLTFFTVKILAPPHSNSSPEMNRKSRIPFGVALAIGAILGLFWDPYQGVWPWLEKFAIHQP